MKDVVKFILALILFLGSLASAFAQSYKPVEVDFGLRYNILTGDYSGGGAGFYFEPRYNVNDQFAVGLRLGFDILGGTIEGDGEEIKLSTSLLSSYVLTGDYMLVSNRNTRVFAGLGLGLSGQGSVDVDDSAGGESGVDIGTVFGVMPRVGVKLGIFKLALDYSLYFNENAKKFLGINAGFSFGGKYNKKAKRKRRR